MHDHEHGHVHAHPEKDGISRALWINVVLNFMITAFEFVAGILSGSYALLSDSMHNLNDVGSVILGLFAHRVSKKPGDSAKTYGYKRAEVIAALFNSVILLSVFAFLSYGAVLRLLHPDGVNAEMVVWMASVALAGNVAGTLALFRTSKKNLNSRAVFVHMLSDSLNSAAVIAVGLLMERYGWYFLDPIATFAIAAYISFESVEIIRHSIYVLMQSAPSGMNFEDMKKDVEAADGVESFHHVHAWSLDGNDLLMECHVRVTPTDTKKIDLLRDEIGGLLKSKYGVDHVTIQFEQMKCRDESIIVNPVR